VAPGAAAGVRGYGSSWNGAPNLANSVGDSLVRTLPLAPVGGALAALVEHQAYGRKDDESNRGDDACDDWDSMIGM